MKLLAEAARMPRADSYEASLLLRRLEILPAGDDVLGRKLTKSYLAMDPPSSRWIYHRIVRAVAARSEELALAGDAHGFLTLADSWEAFVRSSITAGGTSLVPIAPAGDLRKAAKALGLATQEARFTRLEKAEKSRKDATRARWSRPVSLGDRGGASAYGVVSASATIENPPAILAADLKPGRMAEHAMWQRVGAVILGAMMLGIALVVMVVRFFRGMQVRLLSRALLRVLRSMDHAWILLGGVFVPVLIHLLVEHFAPLGEIDFEEAGPLASFAMRLTALAGVMLTLTNLIAARRLGRRLGCLGWEKPTLSPPSAVGLGVAVLLTGGVARIAEMSPALLIGWVFGIILLLLNVLIMPLDALFSPRAAAVRWLTYCRAVVPAYVFAVLLMALLIPFHHAREKHWTRLNVLTKIEPGVPAMNRYEHEVAELMRAELLEILNAKP